MKSLRRRSVLGFLALFGVLVAFYAITYSRRAITDTDLNSLQTRSFVLHGDIDIARYEENPGRRAQVVERDGHVYTIYGVGISLITAPLYVWLVRAGASQDLLQGAVGISFVAASVVVLLFVLLRLVPQRLAIAAAIAFAFGTTMWPVASMAFFQQGPAIFLECIGIAGLFSRTKRGPLIAGAGFGAAAFVRPTLAIPFVVIALVYLARDRRGLVSYAAGAFVPMAAFLVSNRWIWGTWLSGGYSHTGIGFNADAPTSFVGLTVGWWRGLFVYSPVLALGVVGWILALRKASGDTELRLAALGFSCLATLLFYSKWDDWGGGINQFGYRLQLEIVPFLVVLGAYALAKLPRLRPLAIGLGAVSILTMTWGAVESRDRWDAVLFATTFADTSIGRAWDNVLHHPLPGLTLLVGVAFVATIMLAIGSRLAPADPPLFTPASEAA
ncbi:MAG: hypothetical protein WEB06_08895 [Actinomycetota bacterium]